MLRKKISENGLANRLPNKPLDTEKWIKIACYGDHFRNPGLLRLEIKHAREVIKKFNSFMSSIERKLYGGPPIYNCIESNQKIGTFEKMRLDGEGLWIQPKWNEEGDAIIKATQFNFITPKWTLKAIESDIFTPFKLNSLMLSLDPVTRSAPKKSLLNIESLNTKSVTSSIKELNGAENCTRFLKLVQDRMRLSGESYIDCWNTIKRQNPELYQNF